MCTVQGGALMFCADGHVLRSYSLMYRPVLGACLLIDISGSGGLLSRSCGWAPPLFYTFYVRNPGCDMAEGGNWNYGALEGDSGVVGAV